MVCYFRIPWKKTNIFKIIHSWLLVFFYKSTIYLSTRSQPRQLLSVSFISCYTNLTHYYYSIYGSENHFLFNISHCVLARQEICYWIGIFSEIDRPPDFNENLGTIIVLNVVS